MKNLDWVKNTTLVMVKNTTVVSLSVVFFNPKNTTVVNRKNTTVVILNVVFLKWTTAKTPHFYYDWSKTQKHHTSTRECPRLVVCEGECFEKGS